MAAQAQYKRSWKNLLINKRYQLRFTLFMVGLSTLLMVGLGIWVMQVANEATKVSMAGVMACPGPPELEEKTAPAAASPDDNTTTPDVAPIMPQIPDAGSGAGAGAGSAVFDKLEEPKPEPKKNAKGAKADDETERPRAKVQLDDSKIDIIAPPPKIIVVPANFGDKLVERWTCEFARTNTIRELEARRRQILFVLIGTGIFLAFGLGIYGIKMTHKVAGPLFKVGLYLAKMRDGRYDKVYNLRKGDQLVNFYEHFKQAHAGVVEMQKDDIARLKAVVDAAEAAGASDDAVVAELRDMLARKEKSIE